jgi:phage-related tail fiber protein
LTSHNKAKKPTYYIIESDKENNYKNQAASKKSLNQQPNSARDQGATTLTSEGTMSFNGGSYRKRHRFTAN